jgi:hypothetical protein
MVQQRGEPFLLSLLCSFSYTFKPLGHAFPARCPARVLLSRVSLGPFPWLRRLRPATPEVNPLRYPVCSPASSLLWKGLTSPARSSSASIPHLPDADHSTQLKRPSRRSPGSRPKSVPTCQGLRPHRAEPALALSRLSVLPSATLTASAP